MRAFDAIGRRWKDRHEFSCQRDWLLMIYDSFLRRFRSWPLPLRDKVLGVSLRISDRPIFVRMGRADGFFLEEILLRKIYHSHFDTSLGPIRQILDLGGNVGMSVRLWQLLFPDAQILVVEPNSGNFSVLRKNVEGAKNAVTVVQACMGGRSRLAFLATKDRPEGQFQLVDQPAPDAQSVRVATMDELLEEHDIKGDIDLLKCDIEGSEEELFADCRSWIGRVRNLAIELHFDYMKFRLLEDLRRNDAKLEVTAQYGSNVLQLQRRD